MSVSIDRIADALSSASGRKVSPQEIRPFRDTPGKVEIADATLKFLAPLEGTEGFVIVSGDGNPALVDRAVRNIEAARRISGSAGKAILPPVLTGEIDGRAFAVWERQRPLPDGRLGKLVLRWFYANELLDWAFELCANTARPALDIEAQYVAPLMAVRDDPAWPDEMRRDAAAGIDRIGSWQPQQCVQHGDFWTGNVLRAPDGGLTVIDWAGAKIDGYPVIDVMRMMRSLDCSQRVARRYFEALCSTLSCERGDLVSYALSGIGELGGRLEHAPLDRYRRKGVVAYNYISSRCGGAQC
jgi:hypothetical protein